MKQVFEQYASAIISTLIAVTVLAIIIGSSISTGPGLWAVLGQALGCSVSKNPISENQAFDRYMSETAPRIIPKDNYVMANKNVLLADCFQATSHNGKSLPVFWRKAWSMDGEETDLGLSADGTSICVANAGVYWIQVYAVDSNQKEACIQTKLLVNER